MHISLLLATEKGVSRESLESKESAADRRKEAHSTQSDDSGVVVDSATLRLSVGEKIKRLSQRLPEPENPPASSKSSSLPKNVSCKISIFLFNNVSTNLSDEYIHFVLPICTCICHKLYRYIYMSQIIKVNCNIILTFFYIFYKHMYDQKYWKMYYLFHYWYNGFHLLVLFYIFFFYKIYHILYFLASIHVFIDCIS